MLAPHTTCPGCREEVYLDELVKGRCPLCGCTLEDFEDGQGEMEEFIDRCDFSWLVFNYFIFKKFDEMGVSPLKIMQYVSGYEDPCLRNVPGLQNTSFEFDVPFTFMDRIRPKRCEKCGKLFITGGKKIVSGDLSDPGFTFSYHCRKCLINKPVQ
jgi:ribosomal protein S27E